MWKICKVNSRNGVSDVNDGRCGTAGATLQDLSGDGFSAFGTRQEDGGEVCAKVPVASAAAQAGLKEGDLIQPVNGQQTKTLVNLLAVLAESGNVPLKLQLVRDQVAV